MKAREAVLMFSAMLVASAVLKMFPTLRGFVAAHSITVKDTAGRPLYDAI